MYPFPLKLGNVDVCFGFSCQQDQKSISTKCGRVIVVNLGTVDLKSFHKLLKKARLHFGNSHQRDFSKNTTISNQEEKKFDSLLHVTTLGKSCSYMTKQHKLFCFLLFQHVWVCVWDCVCVLYVFVCFILVPCSTSLTFLNGYRQ